MTNNPQSRTGIRQHYVLETMHQHGGIWPPRYKILSDHRHIFESLQRRGLIVRVWVGGKYTYKLATATNK